MQRRGSAVATAVMTLAALAVTGTGAAAQALDDGYRGWGTATPIEHLVVIFQENVSFDHYFGTYPHAANTDGTPFTDTKELKVKASLPNRGIGPLDLTLHRAGPGHYVADAVTLSPGGDWKLAVTDRVSDFDEYTTTVKATVR